MLFDESVKFYGTYRTYQQRVLDNLVSFLDNEKIHVVAAPGSGKTTLGLELIIRLNKPSLILVPSIAIREQWIDRFSAGFLNDISLKDKWISNDIKIQRPIICITYQALYSAYKKEVNSEEVDEENIEEENYDNFNLLAALKEYNISTICLDECHHLKAEWWKALESVIKKVENCSLIALTATPPYDSSAMEWQRYIDLCGPIDEEIFVPELIKDNNLCPHQDYIYFSYPTKEEEKAILKSYANGLKIFAKYKNNERLVEIVKSNTVYTNFDKFKKVYYENEQYYKSLVLFLNENNVKIPLSIKLLVHMEKFVISHMETLLQHVLFDDAATYGKVDILNSLKKELSALGVVHNRKVCIVHDDRIDKKMSLSLSKLDSIASIIKHEYCSIKQEMKCLVLTDYIKQKTKNYIGNNDKTIDSFGTIPIFEYLRRANLEGIKLCCLSGSVCIIPSECKQYLSDDFEFTSLVDENYVEVVINTTNRKKLVLAITDLLNKGLFNVLIGTKALLGEGWDSPCINTLILASFVGSYVLSNQMRGRAIRTDKNNPNKKSNVWHLVCLNPFDYNYSTDYYNLEKRCSTFIGVDLEKQTIENGIDRLSHKKIPINEVEMNKANNAMLLASSNREKVKQGWDDCISRAKQIDRLTKTTNISIKRLRKEYSFLSAFISFFLNIGIIASSIGLYFSLMKNGVNPILAQIITLLILIVSGLHLLWSYKRMLNLRSPRSKLRSIGKALLNALIDKGSISSENIKVVCRYVSLDIVSIYLKNATTYEQNLFSENITQMLGEINQPRYLLTKPANIFFSEYYVVPDAFKKNKELVEILVKHLKWKIGRLGIVFAKNEYGKDVVLRAQLQQYIKFKRVKITTKNILLLNKKTTYKK